MFYLPKNDSDLVIIYCHDSAGTLGDYKQIVSFYAEWFDMTVVAPEYPGYGPAEGTATAESVDDNVLSTYQFVVDVMGFPANNVIFIGYGMGTGPAIHLVSQLCEANNPPAALVSLAGFTAVGDVLRGWRGDVFVSLLSDVIHHHWESLQKLSYVNCPVLFLHGEADEVIPCSHSEALYAVCESRNKVLHLCPSATHTSFREPADTMHPIQSFLQTVRTISVSVFAYEPQVARLILPTNPPPALLLPPQYLLECVEMFPKVPAIKPAKSQISSKRVEKRAQANKERDKASPLDIKRAIPASYRSCPDSVRHREAEAVLARTEDNLTTIGVDTDGISCLAGALAAPFKGFMSLFTSPPDALQERRRDQIREVHRSPKKSGRIMSNAAPQLSHRTTPLLSPPSSPFPKDSGSPLPRARSGGGLQEGRAVDFSSEAAGGEAGDSVTVIHPDITEKVNNEKSSTEFGISVLERYFGCIGDGDLEGILSCLDHNVLVRYPEKSKGWSGVLKARQRYGNMLNRSPEIKATHKILDSDTDRNFVTMTVNVKFQCAASKLNVARDILYVVSTDRKILIIDHR